MLLFLDAPGDTTIVNPAVQPAAAKLQIMNGTWINGLGSRAVLLRGCMPLHASTVPEVCGRQHRGEWPRRQEGLHTAVRTRIRRLVQRRPPVAVAAVPTPWSGLQAVCRGIGRRECT